MGSTNDYACGLLNFWCLRVSRRSFADSIYAATTRNEVLMWVYFLMLLAAAVWVVLLTLDMMTIIILLRGKPHPEAPNEPTLLQFVRAAREAEEGALVDRISSAVVAKMKPGRFLRFSERLEDEALVSLMQHMTPLDVPDDEEEFDSDSNYVHMTTASTTTTTVPPNPLGKPPVTKKEVAKAQKKLEEAAAQKNLLNAKSGDAEEVSAEELAPE